VGAFLANLEKNYFGLDVAEIELICFLLMIVAVLDIAARKIGLPYPVLLVLSGLALSLIPFLPHVGFDPELALLVFLPPLLYPAALFTSWRDFRRNLRPIAMLAFGLVLMTTVSVAWVAHALIPNLPWAAALILGAIVSPPDAIAATAVLQRIKIPRRIVAILEGESLVNDSIALVAYRFGTAAVVTGSFSPTAAILKVPIVGLGGVFVGWLWRQQSTSFSAGLMTRPCKSRSHCSPPLRPTCRRNNSVSPACWRW
jgi:CPA1 family monovalent cation:H+ antiporter